MNIEIILLKSDVGREVGLKIFPEQDRIEFFLNNSNSQVPVGKELSLDELGDPNQIDAIFRQLQNGLNVEITPKEKNEVVEKISYIAKIFDKSQLFRVESLISKLDYTILYLFRVDTTTTTTSNQHVFSNILNRLCSMKSPKFSETERRILVLIHNLRASTIFELYLEINIKSEDWIRKLLNRLVKIGFLEVEPRNIGDHAPIRIYYVKTATKGDLDRAEARYNKQKRINFQEESKQQHFKCVSCSEEWDSTVWRETCPACGHKRIAVVEEEY